MQTAFERTLLRSAQSDAPPPEATEQAWLRFSGMMSAAALSAGAAHVGTSAASGGWARLLRLRALKYLMVSSLAAGALTALWFKAHPIRGHETPMASTQPSLVEPSSPVAITVAPSASGAVVAPPPSAPMPQHPSSNGTQRRHAQFSTATTAKARTTASESAPPSTLSAEIAALDAARKASAAGSFQDALSLLQQFQQDFPRSVLGADAEVATIQTLEASGDHAQAARRAMQFLAQYPNDPHSAALKALLR
jgi:hypothetical protein